MPCTLCLVDCSESINNGNHRFPLVPFLNILECPCRECLVKVICIKGCTKEYDWVMHPLKQSSNNVVS